MARLVEAGVTLREQVNARWPNRDKRSDGWIADQNHASTSFHQPDAQGWVRALDIDEDLGEPGAMRRLADELVEAARTGRDGGRLLHLVYEDKVASGTPGKGHPDYWRWRGSGYDHFQHLHITFTDAAKRDGRPFNLDIFMEDDMPLSDDDIKRIAKAVKDEVWGEVVNTAWQTDGTFDPDNRKPIRAITLLADARGVGRKIAYQGAPTADKDDVATAVVDELADRVGD